MSNKDKKKRLKLLLWILENEGKQPPQNLGGSAAAASVASNIARKKGKITENIVKALQTGAPLSKYEDFVKKYSSEDDKKKYEEIKTEGEKVTFIAYAVSGVLLANAARRELERLTRDDIEKQFRTSYDTESAENGEQKQTAKVDRNKVLTAEEEKKIDDKVANMDPAEKEKRFGKQKEDYYNRRMEEVAKGLTSEKEGKETGDFNFSKDDGSQMTKHLLAKKDPNNGFIDFVGGFSRNFSDQDEEDLDLLLLNKK